MDCSVGIEPNSDLIGIGVRASVYIQVLLPLLPEIVVLLVTRGRPRSVPRNDIARSGLLSSATILITGYAMLFSAIIQAKTKHLTVYHALLTLNLNWLICLASTDLFYFFGDIMPSIPVNDVAATRNLPPSRPGRPIYRHETSSSRRVQSSSRQGRSSSRHRKSSRGSISPQKICFFVLLAMSLHLSLTSAFGVWMFSDPKAFDKQTPNCTTTTAMSMFGADFDVSTSQFRNAWLTIYSLSLLPVFNIFVVYYFLFFFWLFAVHIWWNGILFLILVLWRCLTHKGMSLPQSFREVSPLYRNGLSRNVRPPSTIISFTLTEILFIVSTEFTIRHNNVQAGEGDWPFGQTLTLFLILPALWEALRDMHVAYKEHEAGEDMRDDVKLSPSNRLPWPLETQPE